MIRRVVPVVLSLASLIFSIGCGSDDRLPADVPFDATAPDASTLDAADAASLGEGGGEGSDATLEGDVSSRDGGFPDLPDEGAPSDIYPAFVPDMPRPYVAGTAIRN